MIDFELLEDKKFLKFISSSEFATYLVLRRNIWRSEDKPHYMGLHDLYSKDKKLVCSLEREKVSEITGIALNNISHHLTSLEKKGIIQRIRTGRQNIYVLGEWHYNGTEKIEWFFMEGKFGITKDDLTVSVRPDLRKTLDQTKWLALDNNIEDNKKDNTVKENGDIKILQNISNLNSPDEQIQYVADFILKEMGDKHSAKFYHLVASKIPEDAIRLMISEIKTDGARSPQRVFVHKVKQYAVEWQKKKLISEKSL